MEVIEGMDVFLVVAMNPAGPAHVQSVAPVALPVRNKVCPEQTGLGVALAEIPVGPVLTIMAPL
jgi:hypothetical protein